MPAYDFRCVSCSQTTEQYQPISETTRAITCPQCGGLAHKVLTFPRANPAPFREHFNMAVGKNVHSRRQFADELKKAGERQSARTGLAHDYVPVDLRDREACGVTDEGLESTARAEVAAGRVEAKRYV